MRANSPRMTDKLLARESLATGNLVSLSAPSASDAHVALIVPSLGYGGVEKVMLHLAGGLQLAGCRIDLVTANAAGEFRSRVPDAIRVVDLRSRRVATSLPGLAAYLRREQPDIAIAAMTHTNVVTLLARRLARCRTRVVITEHAGLSRVVAHTVRARVRVMPALARMLYRSADAIVGVSDGVARETAQVAGIAAERIRVIYNPVITDELFAKSEELSPRPWFNDSGPPVVLAVGRLAHEKDFATLIRAFALLRNRRAARLMILGEGSERRGLEALCRKLHLSAQEVALPGFCDNPYPCMRRAAVLALSSLWEGLGLVLVEALALGTPVVATDCPSGPREVLQHGKLGRLVPVGNAERLADALKDVLACPPAIPSADALARFESRTAIAAYCGLIESLRY